MTLRCYDQVVGQVRFLATTHKHSQRSDEMSTEEVSEGVVEQKTPKAGSAKRAPKKAPKKEKRVSKKVSGEVPLTGNQLKVLKALRSTSAGGKTLTRDQLRDATGIKGGYCKMIGSSTVEGGGRGADTGLEPRGLVRSAVVEGARGLSYYITTRGAAALAK